MELSDTLIFRCDASHKIGIGHFMRCVALAQTWKKRGGRVIFLSHCTNSFLLRKIERLGIEFVSVEAPHPDPEDLNTTLDLLLEIKKSRQSDTHYLWMVLDGYHFDIDYQIALKRSNTGLLLIDDYNHQPEYVADILLNQNINSQMISYRCPEKTTQLLGTDYIMLRDEFLSAPLKKKKATALEKILITLGGSDPRNITPEVINALNQIKPDRFNIRVLAGPENKYRSKIIERLKKKSRHRIDLITDFNRMPSHFQWADLAITAGGSTCWEMCFMGVPMLIIQTAENQKAIVDGLSSCGAAIKCGDLKRFSITDLVNAVSSILQDITRLNDLSQTSRKLVDGKGTIRIIAKMIIGRMYLKPVEATQKELLWRWANETQVRKSAFNSNPIRWKEHEAWFESVFTLKNVVQLVAYGKNSRPIGQIRFNVKHHNAQIDYSIDTKYRGLGLGKKLVKLGVHYLIEHYPTIQLVTARVKKRNIISNKIFKKTGFFGTPQEDCIEWSRSIK